MKGYTLLELLIVLALIGLMTGVALPRMATLYERFKWAGERDEALRSIAGLGYQAYRQAKAFELVDFSSAAEKQKNIPLQLPADWSLTVEKPIQYRSNGICDGGKLTLHYEERSLDLIMQPPHCRPEMM